MYKTTIPNKYYQRKLDNILKKTKFNFIYTINTSTFILYFPYKILDDEKVLLLECLEKRFNSFNFKIVEDIDQWLFIENDNEYESFIKINLLPNIYGKKF